MAENKLLNLIMLKREYFIAYIRIVILEKIKGVNHGRL